MCYDRILHAVSSGDVQARLIIHKSRFTYTEHQLQKAIDLGDWQERETNLPVPLAGICARADLDADTSARVKRAIRALVQYPFDHPQASRDYVRVNAQEMSDAVCAQHTALYVNEHSFDIGDDGMRAISRLVSDARRPYRCCRSTSYTAIATYVDKLNDRTRSDTVGKPTNRSA